MALHLWHACASILQLPSYCRTAFAAQQPGPCCPFLPADFCLPIPACLPCLPSDNYCFYVENYDSLDAAYDWAKETLQAHSKDKREFVYTRCGSRQWSSKWLAAAACPLPPPGACRLCAQLSA